ncbi:MAG: hypothetical protein IJX81_01405 [Clostridia bacterium]|nr:hypothetical protein [Clostridia bacterium]
MKNTITKNDLKKFLTNGGATLNERAEAVNFANGFQVSKKDFYILPVSNVGAILAAVNALLNTAKKGEFVGLWCDDGKCYIDISERVKNEKKALRLGTARKQKSIFDWGRGVAIPCTK